MKSKMNATIRLVRTVSVLLGLLLAVPFSASWAQSPNRPVVLKHADATIVGFSSEVLPDGTAILKFDATVPVTGDLTGTLTERITLVVPPVNQAALVPITTFWKLELTAPESGTIEGYYSGLNRTLKDLSQSITQQGEVLSVTGAYLNLYRATILHNATLGPPPTFSQTGTLTLLPSSRR